MAQAALDAGVKHVVWSTLEDTREFVAPGSRMPVLMGKYNVPHFDGKGEANRAFIDRGLPTTLLYTSYYWDNLIHFGMQPQARRRRCTRLRVADGRREDAGHRRCRYRRVCVRHLRARRGADRQIDRRRRRASDRRADGRAA